MNRFLDLFDRLDSTTSTKAKVSAMVDYFREAPPEDAAWATFFLTGRRIKRIISHAVLRDLVRQSLGIDEWVYEECYSAVGDTAETLALLYDSATKQVHRPKDRSLAQWMQTRILPLRGKTPEQQTADILGWWQENDLRGNFMINKLLTGSFRVGVSQTLVIRSLAELTQQESSVVAHRLMGTWEPTREFFSGLISGLLSNDGTSKDSSQPYPFYLASPLDRDFSELGDPKDWQMEWKWDGIRAQLIRRDGQIYLWSRGEELITDRFPEVTEPAAHLKDGTVLDGEVLAFIGDYPAPFSLLQKRIGRQKLSAAILRDAPVKFITYDLLEDGGVDLRSQPLSTRRARLEEIIQDLNAPAYSTSEIVEPATWEAAAKLREESRSRKVEGLMIKRKNSPYGTGRRRGDWWKWKIDPYSIDAVLMYAQSGTGRRANLLTDYTFGIWKDGELVPVAKAYSGLTDEEIRELDRWSRQHTLEKFGPVRKLSAEYVFEIAFEGIAKSKRHKSGFALRFPRMARWRKDKLAKEADTVDSVEAILNAAA